jgi:hypothetical protein
MGSSTSRKAAPPSLTYEPGVILAEGDYVVVHGRFSNIGLPVNWIAADIVRLKDGVLVEHWDVIQDEGYEVNSPKCSVARSRSKQEQNTQRFRVQVRVQTSVRTNFGKLR